MGNYANLEAEFIERTINLIGQYTRLCKDFPFEEQYNYTLTINCMLGLIVMPKEKVVPYIPTTRLTNDFKNEIGLVESVISDNIVTLRDLIVSLRHATAHFDIDVISENEQNLIDYIEFKDNGSIIARFRANEMFAFLQYYANCLLKNIKGYRK